MGDENGAERRDARVEFLSTRVQAAFPKTVVSVVIFFGRFGCHHSRGGTGVKPGRRPMSYSIRSRMLSHLCDTQSKNTCNSPYRPYFAMVPGSEVYQSLLHRG